MKSDATRAKLGLILSVPLIAIGILGAYSALNWLLVEKTGWLSLDDEVVAIWIPFALAGLLAAVLVNPRIRMLRLNEARNIPFLFTIVAVAVICIPTIIAQFYIRAASGTLVHVANASAIAGKAREKYFQVDRLCLDRENPAVKTVAEAAGRHDEDLRVTLYVAVPLCGVGNGIRIGLAYDQTIDNRLSDAEKDAQYREFVKRSQARFDAEDPSRYTYLERIRPSAALRGFEKALADAGVTGTPLVLAPHSEPFERRTGSELGWVIGTLTAGIVVWLAMVLIAPVDADRLARLENPELAEEEEFFTLSVVLPTREHWGLPVLIDTNIAVFVAMVVAGLGVVAFQTDDLIAWGANYGPKLHGLGFFRLLTSQFVHAGAMHLANNMYGLLFAGLFLVPVAANARLIGIYLLCGLGGSVASAWMHPNGPSVGASGAIFGLFGVLIALVALGDKRLTEARSMIFLNGAIFVGLNLALGAITPGIDNAAHIGGLASGLLIGAALFLLDRESAEAGRS